METFDLGTIVRLVVSLGIVVGGMYLVRNRLAKGGRFGRPGMEVVARLSLTRTSSVAVVVVGGRHYLLGAGEDGVRLIDRLDDETVAELRGAGQSAGAPSRETVSPAPPTPGGAGLLSMDDIDGPRNGLLSTLRAMTVRSPGRARSGGLGA